jgi:hypothetical protein
MNKEHNPIENATDKALGKIDKAVESAQTGYDHVAESVRQSANQVGNLADKAVDSGSRYLNQGSHALVKEIEASPLLAIAIASLFGFILGSVFQRRN